MKINTKSILKTIKNKKFIIPALIGVVLTSAVVAAKRVRDNVVEIEISEDGITVE